MEPTLPRPYYKDASVTLYHGDCRDILPNIPAETFDFALTDPPYLVSYAGRWSKKKAIIRGDSNSEWLRPAYSEIWRILKADTLCISFFGWPHADEFLGTWKQIGFRPISCLAFVKDRWGLGQFTRAQHEQAYILAKGRPKKPARAPSDVVRWQFRGPRLHQNQKPIGAMSQMVETYAPSEGVILDPFAGSGTILVAAKSLGRRAVGIEIEERFCETVAKRLFQENLDLRMPSSGLAVNSLHGESFK